jgi:hypothetical protein
LNPDATPIKTDSKTSKKKNPNWLATTLGVSPPSFDTTSFIVVNKIRATASLNSPSPKMIENKTGYS